MSGSSTQQRRARTFLLHMAQDEARAARIKELKESRPELTWEDIAHACGVTTRGAQAWSATGSIRFDNARKLADLFGVTVEYIWSGKQHHDTPDLLGTLAADSAVGRLQKLERMMTEFIESREGRIPIRDAQLEAISLTVAGLLDEFRQAREMRDNQLGAIAAQFEAAHAEYETRMAQAEARMDDYDVLRDRIGGERSTFQNTTTNALQEINWRLASLQDQLSDVQQERVAEIVEQEADQKDAQSHDESASEPGQSGH